MCQNVDVIVIGSGGGSKITRPAANMGKKVAIIEKGPLGGTCLNRGCIPSKMLIHLADIISETQHAAAFELSPIQKPAVDFSALMHRVKTTVQADSDSIAPAYDVHPNISYYQGEARFIAPHTVQVGETVLRAPQIFLPVGGRPHIPAIPGLSDTPFWTSTDALQATQLPQSLCILGGGYIATELGYFYQAMGCQVTFLVRKRMVKGEDCLIQERFEKVFSKTHYVQFNEEATHVSYKEGQFNCTLSSGESVIAEALLVATGITPNSDLLDLDKTGVQTDQQGFIQVDECFETTKPGIFAFGDVIGRYQFRHSVNCEGEHVFNTVVKNGQKAPFAYPPIPHAIFTHPQVAGVGLTEQECVAAGREIVCGVCDYKNSAMGMALRSEQEEDVVKLIFCKQTTRLLGAHIMGREAASMCHQLILGIQLNATLADLLDMVYIHPALSEVVRNAARRAAHQLEAGK